MPEKNVNLEEELKKVKTMLTRARKQGANLVIADSKILNIAPKISMSKITNDKRDIENILKLLEEVTKEIKISLSENEEVKSEEDRINNLPDVKKEEIYTLIEEAKKSFDNKEKCIGIFKKIMEIYNTSSIRTRNEVREICLQLREKISKL